MAVTAAARARLAIRGVSYSYPGGRPVLDDVDMDVTPGALTLVCGASGSGKSTVLRLLNGLIPNFHEGELSGRVLIDDEDVSSAPIERSGLRTATVFQNPASQFFTTTVADELAFAPQNYRVEAGEIRRRRAGALEELGIGDLADRDLRTLSGGQVQKVACAQALAQRTPVILLDEPTSNLDPRAIDDVRATIGRLKAAGRTLVVAEHRVYFLRGLVDEVVIMGRGRVVHRMAGEELWRIGEARRKELGLRALERPRLAVRPAGLAAIAGGPGGRPGADDAAGNAAGDGADGLLIENLQVERSGRLVLDIPRLFFPAGAVTGVVGANGVGKTTLARAVCRLQRARRGARMSLGGRELRSGRAFLVMQDVHRQLFTESVSQEASAPQLERLDLAALADRHPLSLSGGQKQRLVIATAIDQDARVLILDEPTSG
ncbi:MAG: ABC transporter ATP-binding protein, partial [Actinomyces dentalis]